jgi:hypothetical protein
MDFRILLIQRIADLSNILGRIVDLACNLVRILDCDFIVELFADSNLDKTIVGLRSFLQIWADRRICTPLFNPPPPQPYELYVYCVYVSKMHTKVFFYEITTHLILFFEQTFPLKSLLLP